MDGRTIGEGGRALPFSVLRAVQPRRGCRADGIFARLAHGLGKGPCSGRPKVASPKLRNASATARQARSASHSPAMSDCRRRGMRASGQNRRRLRPRHAAAVTPALRSPDHVSSRFGVEPINELIFLRIRRRRRIVDHHAEVRATIHRKGRIFESEGTEHPGGECA